MFFDRFGPASESSPSSSPKAPKVSSSSPRARRLAALTLAAALAGPLAGFAMAADNVPTFVPGGAVPLLAQDQPKASNDELLRRGVEQYRNNQYEEAQATLQQVDKSALSEKDQNTLSDVMSKAEAAAGQRKAARAEFEMGEEARNNKQYSAAAQHYKAAVDNKYADDGTVRKAREQMALAESGMKESAGDLKVMYQEAVNQFNAGDLQGARDKFVQLRDAGYKAPLFKKSPGGYVETIDKNLASRPKETPPSPAPTPAPTPTPETTAPQPTPAPAMAPTPAPETTTQAPRGAAPAPQPEPPAEPQMSGKQYYQRAKKEYNSGDWIAARKDFEAARDANYKPGLFEGDSPATYLSRMDRKEAADRAKNEQEMARQRQDEEDRRRAEEARQQAMAQPTPPPAPEPAPTTPPPAPAPAPAPAPVVETPPPAPAPAPMPERTTTTTERTTTTDVTPAPTTPTPVTEPARGNGGTRSAEQALNRASNYETIRQQQRQYDASLRVQKARDAQNNNQMDDALRLYTEALELDPNNAQAQAGRNQILSLRGQATGGPGPLAGRANDIEIERQAIRYEFDSAIGAANAAIRDRRFGDAQRALNQAKIARDRNPQIFDSPEITGWDQTIARVGANLEREREIAQREAENKANAEIGQETNLRIQEQEAAKRRTVSNLIRSSMQSVREGKYTDALATIDQILILDPNNDYAVGTRALVEDRANLQVQRKNRETFNQQLTKQLNAAEEKKIPYDDIYRYPANWPDISAMRDQTVKEERGEKGTDQAVQAVLDRRLPEVKFDNVGFSDVIDFLRDITGANIFVNWRAMEAAAIDKNAPVTARLRDVKFSKALDIILSDVGGGTVKLGYTVDEGVITISTGDDLSKNVVTRVYDIRDVIFEVPDFTDAPVFDLSQQQTQQGNQSTRGGQGGLGGGGGGGAGGGQGLFGGQGGGQQGQEQNQQSRAERIAAITKLIQDTVASDSWKDNGGAVGSVRELSGQLIVTQTPENQRQLVNLLEQLRETRAIQVTIETRFLTVQRNFLEDIGTDFSFALNENGTPAVAGATPVGTGATPHILDRFGPIAINNSTSTFTNGPTTPVPGSIGGQAHGLDVSATFLDQFQVNFLLRATQASQTSTLLTAPRVTLFNGQRAYVLVATQQAYVADLTPVVGQRVAIFDPDIATVQSGALLDVQATVSSDRKYVTLTLRPQLSTLIALQSFGFQTGSSNLGVLNTAAGNTPANGTGGIVINSGEDTGAGNIQGSGIVQEPLIQITEVRTTVSVPDGGTLLLGGQTIAGEVEREAGVPILSKIPFLKRIFTNRSFAKDEQVLLILVKPTILIQREEEQKQFPLLSSGKPAGTQ